MRHQKFDIEKFKKKADKLKQKHWDLRCLIKGSRLKKDDIDEAVKKAFMEVSEKLDCTECANCCNEISPVLKSSDIKRICYKLKMDEHAFRSSFLEVLDSENLVFKSRPCFFLKDKKCTIYDFRPADCRSYPHLHKKNFRGRVTNAFANLEICPVMLNVFETLSDILGPKLEPKDYTWL